MNHKCKVFGDTVLPQEVTRKQREVYGGFKISVPKSLTATGVAPVA